MMRGPFAVRRARRLLALAAAAGTLLACLAAPGLSNPAAALCPINRPTCGVGPVAPRPPTVPDHAVFTTTLKHLAAAGNVSEGSGPVVEDDFDHVNESMTSPVTLNGCGSTATGGIRSYQWSVNGVVVATGGCTAIWQRPLTHTASSATVTLTVFPTSGAAFSTSNLVTYRDVVIASLGDSAASGEGAPENEGSTAFTASSECDRSGWAASAQAALLAQQSLGASTTVHFWHLACSGASITWDDSGSWTSDPYNSGGLLNPYDGSAHNTYLEPQVQRLQELRTQTGNLPVDRLLLTVGANDTHWADILENCLPKGVLGSLVQTNCVNYYTAAVGPLGSTGTLPAHFAKLHAALTAAGIDPNSVYVTQYFDPLDSLSAQPSACPNEPLAWPNLRKWGVHQIEEPLQADVQAAATGGWHFIDGIRLAFQGHGVCDASPWINSWETSLSNQGNTQGSWHANRTGQLVIASFIFSNITVGL